MKKFTPVALVFSAALTAMAVAEPQEKEFKCGFATERYVIEMTVSFSEPYLGRRLVFYSSTDPQKELCYSDDGGRQGKCPERFVGAVATVRFSVRRRNAKAPGRTSIREHVTVMAQSEGLQERPPFSKTVELVNGVGSDLQVFGYDEAEVVESERIRARLEARQTIWRLFRQALYIDGEEEPFAVVEWRHAVDGIRILRMYSPGGEQ